MKRLIANRFDLEELERDSSSIAAIDEDANLVWVNPAWRAFGDANGAVAEAISPPTNYLGAIEGELRAWFKARMTESLATGTVFDHDYECSSPTVTRTFRMRLYPFKGIGCIVVHSVRVERPQGARDDWEPAERYRTTSGLVVMCSNCRRTQRPDTLTQWDWVPPWVAEPPPRTSHGLCPLCVDYYYPR